MKKRNQIIKKSNTLINAHYKLNINEQKIIYKLISLIHVNDKDFKNYEVKVSDIIEFINTNSKSIYTDIKKYVRNLMKEILIFKTENKETHIHWLSKAEYIMNNGTILFNFHPDLKPYLLDLQGHFTRFGIDNIRKFNSKHSPRIYEILKQSEFKGFVEIEVEELRKILVLEKSYNDYNSFKKYVLLKTQEEINRWADIFFEFEEIKEGRKVSIINFKIKSKKINKEKSIELPIEQENDKKINELIEIFKNKYKGNLDYILTKNLVNEKGIDCVEKCVEEFGNYVKNADEVEKVFYDFTTRYGTNKEYTKNSSYRNSKPVQATNYEQRGAKDGYDDDFFNSLYDNIEYIKE